MQPSPLEPIVLCFSGHDPSGGAGIQADIETLVSIGCYPCTVITALTTQNTINAKELFPQPPEQFIQQARCILQDYDIKAVKIGLIGNADIAKAIHILLLENTNIPVIFDPVLAAGGGKQLSDKNLIEIIKNKLLPCTTLLTPNSDEARIFADSHGSLDDCGNSLIKQGCKGVLLTGGHESDPMLINRFYQTGQPTKLFQWERLPHNYHGSGCTLAASLAGLIAKLNDLSSAVYQAQEYTWHTLKNGRLRGKGQRLPNRFYWKQNLI